jgi:hypothetical protein
MVQSLIEQLQNGATDGVHLSPISCTRRVAEVVEILSKAEGVAMRAPAAISSLHRFGQMLGLN